MGAFKIKGIQDGLKNLKLSTIKKKKKKIEKNKNKVANIFYVEEKKFFF